jgi:hypothetical protein
MAGCGEANALQATHANADRVGAIQYNAELSTFDTMCKPLIKNGGNSALRALFCELLDKALAIKYANS